MYSENTRRTYEASSISMLVSGTLLILITSLFVNAGAPKQISENDIKPNMVVMNTVIASASSGLIQVFMNQYQNLVWDDARNEMVKTKQVLFNFDVTTLCNSVIAGLVSVSASSFNIELWAAGMIGGLGFMIYYHSKKTICRYGIDDPMDITEVHGICGIWSVLAVGLFDKDVGLLYTGTLDQLMIQILGATAYTLWAMILSFTFFYSLKQNDRLRVDPLYEIIGMDFMSSDQSVLVKILREEERREFIRLSQKQRHL